jgi:hypothetical protein
MFLLPLLGAGEGTPVQLRFPHLKFIGDQLDVQRSGFQDKGATISGKAEKVKKSVG